MRKWLPYALSLIFCLTAAASAGAIRVSAAISLKEAVTEIARAYQADGGDEVLLTFGSSGQLATQIKSGAEVDAFISAADKQVDDLAKDQLVDAATRVVIARNTLVLVVPAGAAGGPTSFEALADPAVRKIAIGEPTTVPAGDYAMQVLTALNLAGKLDGRLVYGTNVRQVLTYVQQKEASAGIVYATDAREAGNDVKVVATAREGTHAPIVYPAVVVSTSKHAEQAARFLAYLRTPQSRTILAAKGFLMDAPAATTRPATAPAK